jgi:hypothetical protein
MIVIRVALFYLAGGNRQDGGGRAGFWAGLRTGRQGNPWHMAGGLARMVVIVWDYTSLPVKRIFINRFFIPVPYDP